MLKIENDALTSYVGVLSTDTATGSVAFMGGLGGHLRPWAWRDLCRAAYREREAGRAVVWLLAWPDSGQVEAFAGADAVRQYLGRSAEMADLIFPDGGYDLPDETPPADDAKAGDVPANT